MSGRERNLAVIVGGGAAVAALYFGVNMLFLTPIREAKKNHETAVENKRRLQLVLDSEKELKSKWKDYAGRTFSYKGPEAQDRFGQDLKRIAKRHGFDAAGFKPKSGSRLGKKTDIATLAYRITAIGEYSKALGFLRDIYQTPYLCRISNLSITPMGPKIGRDVVKTEFTVETLLLSEIKKKKDQIKGLKGLPVFNPEDPPSPFREGLQADSHYLALRERNIFRSFMPAPSHMVMIDNQDRKTVGVKVTFFWEGKENQQLVETVTGKSQKPVSGKGDIVEITGSYADGEPFGPKRIDFTKTKAAVYKVAAHTPDLADTIILAANNEHEEEVFVTVVMTTEDNKTTTLPTMVVNAGSTIDLGEWKAKQVLVTARYKSDKTVPTKTLKPGKAKQTYRIPPEAEEVKPDEVVVAPPITDPPPDATLTVSGLWTYPGVQEMIVTGAAERKVITTADAGAVDGGTLLAVHPLGGIVKMPTGNFYVYPLGKKFAERVLLRARSEAELAGAIDAWTRAGGQPSPEPTEKG